MKTYVKKLCGKIDKKIELLSKYKIISSKMFTEDIDELAELVASRQTLILESNEISASIKSIAKKESGDNSVNVLKILTFVHPEVDEELLPLEAKVKDLESILLELSSIENKLGAHIEKIKINLEDDMQNSNQGKKIIDYCSVLAKSPVDRHKFDVTF